MNVNKRLICIVGPDGTGKSTQTKLLINYLEKNNIKCKYMWMRRPYFFTFPILFMARYMGLSIQSDIGGGLKIGYHNFEKSKIISTLFINSILLDTIIFNILKIKIPLYINNNIIVCDRYIHDIIVDSTISIGKNSLSENQIMLPLLNSIPKECNPIILIAPEEVLKPRRKDIHFDTTMSAKISFYKILANEQSIPTIDANLSIEEVHKKIINLVIE